jgi:MtN3 and saliva related transmembrane protein
MNPILLLCIGLIAGIGTTISFVPQVVKIWKKQSVEDLSIYTFLIHCTGVGLWIVYGFNKQDYILVGFNIISMLLCLCILVAFYKLR